MKARSMVSRRSQRAAAPAALAGTIPVRYKAALDATSFSTPEKIRAAWAGVRAGRPSMMMQVLQEVQSDLYILGEMRSRRIEPSRYKWQVKAGIEGDAKAEEIAKACEAMLKNLNLRRAILHLQDAVLFPFAALEIEWDNTGSMTVPKKLHRRLAREFTFDYENHGSEIRLLTDISRPEGEELEPNKWIVHYSSEKGETLPAEGGLSKGIAMRWLLMTMVLIYWASFTERYGEPWRVAKYDPNMANDDQIAAIEDALRNMGADAAGVFPNFVEIMIKEAQRDGSVNAFERFIDMQRKDIAVGILGQNLTSSGSDDGSGSLALGEVHNEVRHSLIEFDGANLSETFNQTLIKWFVEFNWGEQEVYPEFEILTAPPVDIVAVLSALQIAQNMGHAVTAGQISEIVNLDLPEGIKANDILEPRSSGFGLTGDLSQARSKLQAAHRRSL